MYGISLEHIVIISVRCWNKEGWTQGMQIFRTYILLNFNQYWEFLVQQSIAYYKQMSSPDIQ